LSYFIKEKTHQIEGLQEENYEHLRLILSYKEIDLEIHNLHYTNYAEEQQNLEEGALDEVFDQEKREKIDALEEKHGCRIQQLISKLRRLRRYEKAR
jgi:hypothetical protein